MAKEIKSCTHYFYVRCMTNKYQIHNNFAYMEWSDIWFIIFCDREMEGSLILPIILAILIVSTLLLITIYFLKR